ncbi:MULTISPECIES: DUF58 domain-containing protein [Galbibacter]|uniref:DUF58 domain-containing protein n=1 Tax=Galbibacter pacificus TaxID=2996052 RepID=A0ABT6FVA9_9FLAO|nr:DUF58 domain-containing protein [Galbibacter pacificus]MDG3583877.1 DUF58 domain-containing protein [Galbibacter pacificus]MDG3587205.1 DUF58 domain-containing protein [Galbibacter pacificus]
MAKAEAYPKNVFISLGELLKKEHMAHHFSLLARKHKVNSVLSGKHASKLRGRGLDFEEVRNYVKGDDIRNIDWKVTARTQKTHTRVYTEEKEKPVLIVVDQSYSMFFGSVNKTKAVVAAELAAITAFRVFKEGDRVGGVIFSDDGYDVIAPKRNRKNIVHLLEKIVQRNHKLKDARPVAIDDTLKNITQRIRNIVTHDFLVVIISDFVRYDPGIIRAIAAISRHNDLIVAKINDPMEHSIPNTKFVAGNMERQISVDGRSKKISEAFKKGFDKDFFFFQDTMKKYRIPVFMIDTITPIEDQLKDVFGKINTKS